MEFHTSSYQNIYANHIIMSDDITHKQIFVYKQGVVCLYCRIFNTTQIEQLVLILLTEVQ